MKPMPAKGLNGAGAALAVGLVPGVSYFQVLEPSTLIGANGEQNYSMVGPFLDLARANQYSAGRPGSLITVTLILHQAPPAAPAGISPELPQRSP